MTVSNATGTIPPATTIGTVHLTVADLERALAFYTGTIGFQIIRRANQSAMLGVNGRPLLLLTELPGARSARGVTGLYHFAILLPSRRDLAIALAHLLELRTPLQGASDHAVSEAIYLADPDGNGIEIYRDRPRAEWPHAGSQVRMTVDPFDADGVLGELTHAPATWSGLPAGTVIGHMHLHVAHLAPARRFYCDILGFALMQRFGNAAEFVAAGGYHHHIGYNVWAGIGAPPPDPDMVGLRWFTLRLPDRASVDAILRRAEAAGLTIDATSATEVHNKSLPLLRDPSSNGVAFEIGRAL
ncbi:MAG: VOC family protein [Roseiflexaceae bacterium]|nr:VOC family protein [Roseiflexus sp.]MDW8212208.1 VOC family protein [Roseiflexaceae bacterium]